MPSASPLPAELADLLGRGGTVITGNQRAARTLRLAFDRQCRESGLGTWRPPSLFAWDTWTAGLYRKLLLDGRAARILLNRSQELRVWHSVIEADKQWTSLQAVASLAAMAADAWQHLCAYRGQRRLHNLGVSSDTRAFQRWAQAFARRSKAEEYLSAAELEETLAAQGDLLTPSSEIWLTGFDRKTPAQQMLIDALLATGVQLGEDALAPPASPLYLNASATPADEMVEAAYWVRELLAANPQARVAVIAPSLSEERGEIDRVFRNVLAPELEEIATTASGPYEFSLGQPLASLPIVATALDLLRLTTGALPIASISRTLLSPYFATGPEELSARAEFDAFELRRTLLLRPELTLARLVSLASTSKRSVHLTGLRRDLRSLQRSVAKLVEAPVKQRPYAVWGEIIQELLASSGWPGSTPLDSVEFQARQKFDAALDELATLDFEGIRTSFTQALTDLEALLQRTLFAPESREAPIQIMSPLEAAGSRFDALVFLRAGDLEWPVRATTNPLVGWRLQRELKMPGSDAALDFAHAQRLTNRIAAAAATVVFSYAKQTAESPQRPSPLLAGLRPELLDPPKSPLPQTVIALDTIEEQVFIPLAHRTVPGGAGVLKAQAACGFRAFAEKRLWSTPIETPEAGMDTLHRGIIVHDVLDHLWNDLRTQAALRALSPEQRTAQLSRSIEHSLRREAARLEADPAATAWNAAYLDLQRERLQRLLSPWLDVELGRPPFEVALREENETATIGPLSLRIRVDRVDQLLDERGGSVLIDYKTGVAQPSSWATDRPDEPQLPLYAVLREPKSLAAVAFASIRAGSQMALEGYVGRKDALPKASNMPFPDLQAQLEDWKRVLTALAEDFAEGDARVRPKAFPKTCKHCAQRMLCRLDPASLLVDDDAEAFEEEDA